MHYKKRIGENGAAVLTAQPIGWCSATEATGGLACAAAAVAVLED